MKRAYLLRAFALLLCLGALLTLFACDAGELPEQPPEENSIPTALSLYTALWEKANAANGRLFMQTDSYLQMEQSALRVSLCASTDGKNVHTETEIVSDGKRVTFSYAYTDGALRADGKVTPMTSEEYRAIYGFPAVAELDAVRLVGLPVYREIGAYCFTVTVNPSNASGFLRGILGQELFALYESADCHNLNYSFHFKENGELDRMNIHAELILEGNSISLSSSVRYTDFGTAQPT